MSAQGNVEKTSQLSYIHRSSEKKNLFKQINNEIKPNIKVQLKLIVEDGFTKTSPYLRPHFSQQKLLSLLYTFSLISQTSLGKST